MLFYVCVSSASSELGGSGRTCTAIPGLERQKCIFGSVCVCLCVSDRDFQQCQEAGMSVRDRAELDWLLQG